MVLIGPLARMAVGEDRQLIGPLQKFEREADRLLAPADHADAFVAHFVAVAVGAVEDAAAVVRLDVGDVGQLVANAVGEDDAARAHRRRRSSSPRRCRRRARRRSAVQWQISAPAASASLRPRASSSPGGMLCCPRNPWMAREA